MSTDTNHWSCWVAYYPDYSNVFVFGAEIEALRFAVEHADMIRDDEVDWRKPIDRMEGE